MGQSAGFKSSMEWRTKKINDDNFIYEIIQQKKNYDLFGSQNRQKILQNIRKNIKRSDNQVIQKARRKYETEVYYKQTGSTRIKKEYTEVGQRKGANEIDYFEKYEEYRENGNNNEDD